MGAYLNKPVTEKDAEQGENEWLKFASTSMQGWRAHQEVASIFKSSILKIYGCNLFGVYDGHGGAEVAIYIAKNFPQFLKNSGLLNSGNLEEALKKSFVDFDITLKDEDSFTHSRLDEEEEREQLFEEAMALSKEASVSIESIIMQYAKIRNQMGGDPKLVFMDEAKVEKRALGEPSSRLVKRRRIHRDNAVLDEDMGEDVNAASEASIAPSGSSVAETTATKVNGSAKSASGEGATNGGLTSSSPAEVKTADSSNSVETNAKGKDSTTCEETVSSSTSVDIIASKSIDSDKAKKVEEPDSNTDEEDDDEDYEEDEDDADAEDGEVVDESESEDDEIGTIETNGGGENKPGFDSGATACLALLFKDKALDLSVDHKPEDTLEKSRIEKAGGIVSEDGRVNGGLNLSRALGDHYYKQNSEVPFEKKDTLLIIACDGIWNSLSSQEVVDFISKRLGTTALKEIGAQICDHCCAADTSGDGTGCDNMTIIIVDLKKANSAVCSQSPSEVATDQKEDPIKEKA
uniref:protein-serine/threonine phosphatase n=1 Tax=Ditylenchus dipsaci TaxID=166011 RepID=A0A915D710_9BILA